MTDYFSLATGIGQRQPDQQPVEPAQSSGLKGGIGPRYDDFANLKQPQQAAPVEQQAQIVPVVDYFKAAAGIGDQGTDAPDANAPDPNATPDAPTFIGRRIQDIQGKQDQRFKDLGTVFDQFPNELRGPTAEAATFGADDAAMGDIIQKNLGDKFIRREKDANGYDIFVTRGPDGQEQRGYVNKPGLDLQDVARAGYGSLPYLAIGGATGAALKGAGIGLRALGQFAANAGTSIAGDVANRTQGSEQGIDPTKAAIVGGVGAIAEPIASAAGALWRKFVTIPGLIDKTTGQLTQKGIDAARQAGIDPTDITPDFAQSFAKSLATSGDPAQAATQAGLDRFGIPATKGQITKDPYLLTQEEGMRRRLYGESAQDTMRGFDQKQQDAIRTAALGQDPSNPIPPAGTSAPKQGIGDQINPDRQPGGSAYDRMPSTLGTSVQDTLQTARQTAKSAESALWDDNVKNLAATPQALANLTPHMETALANETAFTPTGEAMAKEIGSFVKGELPVNEAGGIKLKPIQSVDQMRRRLGALVGSAEDGADKRQAGMIYDAFNDWIGESADKALLAGDPAAAMQLVKARGFTREVRDIFNPMTADGKISPAGQRLSKILDTTKADSGEAVIDALLGSQGSRSVSPGTLGALQNIKKALDRFATPEQAAQAWNDIRLAHWTRLVTGRNGEMLGATAILNNLKSAIQSQNGLMQTLYTPLELRQMREFAKALEAVSFKPPNASGSGYSAAQFAKEGFLKLLDSFGIGTPARAVFERTGIGNAWNAAAAKQAVSRSVRPTRPNLAPFAGAIGQAEAQSR